MNSFGSQRKDNYHSAQKKKERRGNYQTSSSHSSLNKCQISTLSLHMAIFYHKTYINRGHRIIWTLMHHYHPQVIDFYTTKISPLHIVNLQHWYQLIQLQAQHQTAPAVQHPHPNSAPEHGWPNHHPHWHVSVYHQTWREKRALYKMQKWKREGKRKRVETITLLAKDASQHIHL